MPGATARSSAVSLGFGERGLLEKGSCQKSPFSRDSREFRDSGAQGWLPAPPQTSTKTLAGMKKQWSWWQKLLLLVCLCTGKAIDEGGVPEVKRTQGLQKRKLPQRARVGGGRRLNVQEDVEPLGMAPAWQMQQRWQTLQEQALTAQEGIGQYWHEQHVAESVTEEMWVLPTLFMLGLCMRRARSTTARRKLVSNDEDEKQHLPSMRIKGKQTMQCHSQLKAAHMPFMRDMKMKDVRGDGNCYWRALAIGTGASWLRLKQRVLAYAKEKDPLWAIRHQKRGTWIDN